MKEIGKQILMNQLSIMTALQRFDYKLQKEVIIEDLGQRIEETQKLFSEDLEEKFDI